MHVRPDYQVCINKDVQVTNRHRWRHHVGINNNIQGHRRSKVIADFEPTGIECHLSYLYRSVSDCLAKVHSIINDRQKRSDSIVHATAYHVGHGAAEIYI